MQCKSKRVEAFREAEVSIKKSLTLLIYFFSILICSVLAYWISSYKFRKENFNSMALSAISMNNGNYEDAILHAYRAAGGEMIFEAIETIGDSYYCMGDKMAAEVNYRLAMSLTNSKGMKDLLKFRIEAMKDGGGGPNFPKCR